MARRYIHAGILLCLLLWPAALAVAENNGPRSVRVGAFNYYPALFQDTDGAVKGFYADLLGEIAARENLKIEYVYGSWAEGLQRIRSGEVDVLTSVAYTPERDAFMDYPETPLLTVWGELYVPLSSDMDSILKVRDKTIAVMKNDYNGAYFVDLVRKFNLPCRFVEMAEFDDIFAAVAAGRVDAGVVNSTFGVPKQRAYGLRSTGVAFNPFDIYFTVAQGKNGELLALLDRHLKESRRRQDSVYLQSQRKWQYGSVREIVVVPRWLILSAVALGILSLGTGAFVFLLRRRVRKATEVILEREANLRQSAEMIELLLNSTAEAIYGLDLQGRCTLCNAACLRMLGYEKTEELIGTKIHGRIRRSPADGTPDAGTESSPPGRDGTHVVDELLWRRDGTSFPAETWSYPLRRDGLVLGSVVTFVDITLRKETEEDLKEKNAEIERFTYTVSHDLKSPLVTIKTFLGYLQQDLASGEEGRVQRDIGYMETAVDKMALLLDELLRMSRLGRVVHTSVPVTFRDLVEEALAAVAGPLAEKGVKVQVADEDLTLYGDRRRLAEIWQNLIENAAKYMGTQQEPHIEIGMETLGADRVFYVRDNGMGIDTRHQEKIFGLFEKLDPESEGSGLGLALVKRIVDLHKGKLWLVSEGCGLGCCFRFTLPAATNPQGGA